ncbi:MFS transporter [Candidatus Nomurabacteria bacterium]|nr:MFS transporter [Candidatus Nomurabacteria bacterium]
MFKDNSKLKNIFFLGFLLSLHLAFVSYISSSFLSTFSNEKYVSLIYVSGSILSLFLLFIVPVVLKKIGEYKFLLLTSLLSIISLLLLSTLNTFWGIIPVFVFYFALNSLIVFALDELVQIYSKNSSMGHVRGLYLTVINLAWVVSQIISGRTLSAFSFSTIYFVAFVIMSIFFIFVLFGLRKLNDPKYDNVLAWQSFKNFFTNKNLARAYKINFLLQFFYVWMVVYTPIYLYAHLGFDWKEIGIIFTVMLLPFVFIQYPLGKYSDKIGERHLLMLGFFVTSLSTLSLFFIEKHEVLIWALALFCTRIGAAIVEVMSDVYFFKHIKKENDEFIAVYRNTSPVAYVVAPVVAFGVFYFVPSFNFIFLILGALVSYGIYLASTIRKNDF